MSLPIIDDLEGVTSVKLLGVVFRITLRWKDQVTEDS